MFAAKKYFWVYTSEFLLGSSLSSSAGFESVYWFWWRFPLGLGNLLSRVTKEKYNFHIFTHDGLHYVLSSGRIGGSTRMYIKSRNTVQADCLFLRFFFFKLILAQRITSSSMYYFHLYQLNKFDYKITLEASHFCLKPINPLKFLDFNESGKVN